MDRETIYFEEGWEYMQKGITKLKNSLEEGLPEPMFDKEEYSMLSTKIRNMSTQKPPHDYSQQLYDKYRESFEEYITSTILPSLRDNHDEFMLRELVKRWANHKIMVKWLACFFLYLDRYFVRRRSLPPLKEVGFTCFRDLVYQEFNAKVRDALISLIHQEREGEQIDRALLKNVLDIFVEIGMGKMDYYERDFEAAMLEDTGTYYEQKASKWQDDSCRDYMLKAGECLRQEKDRVAHYLDSSSEPKLLEMVHHELFSVYGTQLLQKEHFGDDKLYEKQRKSFEEYITSTVLPCLREKHDEFLLKELVERWAKHKNMFMGLSHFFHYLDPYVIAQRSLPPLNEVGLTCFHDLVYQELHAKVRDAVISLIDQEREGEQIDRALLKNVLDIFVEIGMGQMDHYENDFEAAMLKDTAAYYSRKASNWILEDSCPDYMLKAEECLRPEKDRASYYLHSSSEPKLLEKVQHELLSVYATQLLEKEHSGCHALLRDNKVEDLSRMFRLFSKIPRGLDPVSNIFKQHVTAEGMTLVKQAEDAASTEKAEKKDMVGLQEQVFVLHDKYLACVNDCFQNHTLFHKALKEAFEVFCNKGVAGSSSAELLATFCDNILKKGGSEKLSDKAIEETLEKVMKLFAYISDKYLFAEFYRKKLARRLIFYKSANDDHERCMLTKLKQQCGGQFTSKMEGMVTDLTLAKENQTSFEEYLSNNPQASPGINLTVTVLTTGFWPSYKSFNLNLPPEMVKCVEVFKEFYQTKTKRRKLTWIYSLGNCNIIGKFEPKTMELIVTTSQASALLLFNSSERLSYSEIMTQLNLSDDDVVRLLHSLSCAKYKILNKEPNSRTVSPTDVFEFNSKFTDKMRRIKIPLPPVDEKKKVIEDVVKDKRHAIDASIVRIMKSRKVLGHQQLVMECVKELGRMFKPDFKAIKKRIEDLITRDYLERDKDNPKTLRYLA
ncbi:hypothetical protein UlMin_009524 [Ulmus minor]